MQIDRLFQIVYVLLEKRKTTAPELASMFDVSVRTIYRDLDTLSIAGIPIYTVKGKGGGIYMMDDFVMEKSMLTDKEQNYLLFGLETLKATKYDQVDEALGKLKGIFNKKDDAWLEVDFSHWGSGEKGVEKFEVLKQGLVDSRELILEYRRYGGEYSKRKILPLKLVFKERDWYLSAFCLKQQDYRLFKVARIEEVQLGEDTFNRSDYELSHVYDRWTGKSVKYTLRFPERAKYRVFEEFHHENIITLEDGSYQVTIEVQEGPWIVGYIISYGEDIEIIKPLEIRETIRRRLQELMKVYS